MVLHLACKHLSFLRIWSHLLKKSVMENFIFCAVRFSYITFCIRLGSLKDLKEHFEE